MGHNHPFARKIEAEITRDISLGGYVFHQSELSRMGVTSKDGNRVMGSVGHEKKATVGVHHSFCCTKPLKCAIPFRKG